MKGGEDVPGKMKQSPLLGALSVTERLALLHTATVLASASLSTSSPQPLGPATFWTLLLVACVGYLALLFIVSKREREAIETALAKPSVKSANNTKTDFAICVADVRTNQATGRVEYKIEGIYNESKWSAWLRYSTLHQLKGRAGSKADEAFPGKTSITQWVRGSDSDIAFIDDRRRSLNKFLKEAVPTKEAFEVLAQVPQVKQALGLPNDLEISSESSGFKQDIAVKVALEALDATCNIAKFAVEAGGDGWSMFDKSNDGITCFMKKEGEFTYVMSKGPMDVDKLRAFEFMVDFDARPKWDDMFKKNDELENYLQYTRAFSYPTTEDPLKTGRSQDWEIVGLNIARTTFASPAKAFVAERDSVCVGVMGKRRSDGALCLALKSVQHPKAPEGLEGYTRAKVIVAGFLFEDRKDGKPGCMMTNMGLVDPNGAIPQFVINLVAKQRAFVVRDINKACLSTPPMKN